jgi:hypothetical protein
VHLVISGTRIPTFSLCSSAAKICCRVSSPQRYEHLLKLQEFRREPPSLLCAFVHLPQPPIYRLIV